MADSRRAIVVMGVSGSGKTSVGEGTVRNSVWGRA